MLSSSAFNHLSSAGSGDQVNVDVQPACENDDDHVFWYYYTCADWASDMTGSGVMEDSLRDVLFLRKSRTAEIGVHLVR